MRDRRLARALREVAEEVASLDSGQHSRGICHGDFELDNIRFGPGGVTFFDADEAHRGWFAGDVALAVRDLTGTTLESDGQAQWVQELAASLREHQEWHRERLLQHRI